MTGEPEGPDRPDNLWQPVARRPRVTTAASIRAPPRWSDWQLWADMHRGRLAAAGGCLAGPDPHRRRSQPARAFARPRPIAYVRS